MKLALLKRLEHLETTQAFQEGDRRLKIEFAYLKQLRANTPVLATSSPWAGVRMGGRSPKSDPASRRPNMSRLATKTLCRSTSCLLRRPPVKSQRGTWRTVVKAIE